MATYPFSSLTISALCLPMFCLGGSLYDGLLQWWKGLLSNLREILFKLRNYQLPVINSLSVGLLQRPLAGYPIVNLRDFRADQGEKIWPSDAVVHYELYWGDALTGFHVGKPRGFIFSSVTLSALTLIQKTSFSSVTYCTIASIASHACRKEKSGFWHPKLEHMFSTESVSRKDAVRILLLVLIWECIID